VAEGGGLLTLRNGPKKSIKQALPKDLNEADGGGDLVSADTDFAPKNGLRVFCPFDIVLIDNSHLVRE
jgi:hypothetical protein